MTLILVRYVGEIGIKGKNRGLFVKRLRRNLRGALKKSDISGRVWSEGQRVYVEVEEQAIETTISCLRRVFGVASLSPVSRVATELDAIRSEALAIAGRTQLGPSDSYRVATRRADKSFPYTSPEVNRIIGSAIGEATQARVDLSERADLTVGIEIRPEGTMLYGQVVPGPGGMPPRLTGPGFCLALRRNRLPRSSVADDAPRLQHHPSALCAKRGRKDKSTRKLSHAEPMVVWLGNQAGCSGPLPGP